MKNFALGKISSVTDDALKARVTFKQFEDKVSSPLPICYMPMTKALITGDLSATITEIDNNVSGELAISGEADILYIPNLKEGDHVVVVFFSDGFQDGAIIGKVTL